MRKWNERAIVAFAALSVCAAGALAVGCADKAEKTENAVKISKALKEAALDLHVKQGEAIFAETSDGIALDVSKVNAQGNERRFRDDGGFAQLYKRLAGVYEALRLDEEALGYHS